MAWLIGIICIILVCYFWRFFVPLLGVIIIFGGIGYLIIDAKGERDAKKHNLELVKKAQKIRTARANATSKNKQWVVTFKTDPASGEEVPRGAYITSNSGLCELNVENRINGTKLTGIYCPDFELNEYDDIQVKFDDYKKSDSMGIDRFRNGNDIYIKSYQYSHKLKYEEFIRRLKTSKTVALQLATGNYSRKETFWETFTLKNSAPSLTSIGHKK